MGKVHDLKPRNAASPKPAPPPLPTGRETVHAKADAKAPMREIGGSQHVQFNQMIYSEVLRSMRIMPERGEAPEETQRNAAVAAGVAVAAFKPADEIEGMLAAQAVAMHFGAMECFRRAMLGEQPAEIASKLRKDGTNMARGMTDMLAALDRKRGKGQQHIRVERVMVADGGQAIVGNVTTGSGTSPALAAAATQPMIEQGAAPMDVLDRHSEK